MKWDGFRAIVSTEGELRVRSRRGWNMTTVLPELRRLPSGLVVVGELIAFRRGEPYFPDVCRRVLNADRTVPFTLMIFDLLQLDGEDMTPAAVPRAPEPARGARPRRPELDDAGHL